MRFSLTAAAIVLIAPYSGAVKSAYPERVRQYPGGILINLPVTFELSRVAFGRLPQELMETSVSDWPAALERRAAELDGGKPASSESVQSRHRLLQEVLDADIAVAGMDIPEPDKRLLRRDLHRLSGRFERAYAEDKRALLDRVSAQVDRAGELVGRTWTLPLEDGSVLAVKSQQNVQYEASMMARSRLFGLPTPIPLSTKSWILAGKTRRALTYLVPASQARDYFSYHGSPLSGPAEERAAGVRSSALLAIEQLATLERHGHFHSSLAAMSHTEARWEWDYWRVDDMLFFPIRFGPSSITHWPETLLYPNLRASGLADYEHVEEWKRKPNERAPIYGQNLSEWALATMRGAFENDMSAESAGRLVADGLLLWARLMVPRAASEADYARLRSVTASFARRFYFVERVDKTSLSVLAFGRLPGLVIHSLLMNAISPLVQTTQEASVAPNKFDGGVRRVSFEILDLGMGYLVLVGAVVGLVYSLMAWSLLPLAFVAAVLAVWFAAKYLLYMLVTRPLMIRKLRRPWIVRPRTSAAAGS